jgi:hypothetical protein
MSEKAILFNQLANELLTFLVKAFPTVPDFVAFQRGLYAGKILNINYPMETFAGKAALIPKEILSNAIEQMSFDDPAIMAQLPWLSKIKKEGIDTADCAYVAKTLRELLRLAGIALQSPNHRADSFNQLYRVFLQEMAVAFPTPTTDVLSNFETAVTVNPCCVLEVFREVVKKDFSGIIGNPAALTSTPALFAQLPHVRDLPLAQYWERSVLSSTANSEELWNHITAMMNCATGLDCLPADLTGTIFQMMQNSMASGADLATMAAQVVREVGSHPDLLRTLTARSASMDIDVLTTLAQGCLPPDMQQLADPVRRSVSMGSAAPRPAFASSFPAAGKIAPKK